MNRILCLTIFILLIHVDNAAAGDDLNAIRLGAFYYPPFYYEQNDSVKGIAVEISEELFSRMGIIPDFRIFPLKRTLFNLEHGDIDGVMFLIKTEERERFLEYSVPVLKVKGVIWSSASRPGGPVEFTDFNDLEKYRIGITRGYSYGESFDKFLNNADTDTANSDLSNLKKLSSGRIDVFPANELVVKGLFKLYPEYNGKFKNSEKSFIEWTLYMTLSRKSPFIGKLPEINRILEDMIKSGFIEKTVVKYTE